jgi:hypothetical protein
LRAPVPTTSIGLLLRYALNTSDSIDCSAGVAELNMKSQPEVPAHDGELA